MKTGQEVIYKGNLVVIEEISNESILINNPDWSAISEAEGDVEADATMPFWIWVNTSDILTREQIKKEILKGASEFFLNCTIIDQSKLTLGSNSEMFEQEITTKHFSIIIKANIGITLFKDDDFTHNGEIDIDFMSIRTLNNDDDVIADVTEEEIKKKLCINF